MQLNQIGFKASMLTLEPQFVTTPNFGAAVGSADYFLATPVMPFVLYNSFFPAVDSKYQAVFISLASFVSCWVNVSFYDRFHTYSPSRSVRHYYILHGEYTCAQKCVC